MSLSRADLRAAQGDQGPAKTRTQIDLTRPWRFRAAGIGLDAAGRAKAQALSDKMSQLSTISTPIFLRASARSRLRPPSSKACPRTLSRAQARAGRQGRAHDRLPDYQPVMTYAKSGDLRQRFHREYTSRAYPDNDAILRDLINTREELAKLVGRPNYATLKFENRMLNTPDKVQALIDEMAAAASPAAARLCQEARGAAAAAARRDRSSPGTAATSAARAETTYAYDRQEARKYFAYNNVRDGILELTEDLFGVEIRPWKTPVWDASRPTRCTTRQADRPLLFRFAPAPGQV